MKAMMGIHKSRYVRETFTLNFLLLFTNSNVMLIRIIYDFNKVTKQHLVEKC